MKILFLLLTFISFSANAWDDPTKGKPFFPWVWEDQLKPTLKKSVDGHGTSILLGGFGATFLVRPYDHKIYDHNKVHGDLLIGKKLSKDWGYLGNGALGIGIASLQLAFDQENGLKTIRAMLLASTSAVGMSALTRRNRPDNRTDFLPWASSFPSGHTTNAFVLAGSLSYSYGWRVATPAYALASTIALSRVKENRHWVSDIVAGVTLGTFWARASYMADKNPDSVMVIPVKVEGGLMLVAVKDW